MFRYTLLVVLMGIAFLNVYCAKPPRRREYFNPEPDYGDYDDYDYRVAAFAKDSDAGNQGTNIFSHWNNFLKRTRLPSWNITNPFRRLFSPYVIKVDFPPSNDPNVQPTRKTNKKKKQEDYIYLNTYPSSVDPDNAAQYFYDPVTQQYYEIHETASQDYNPQNNYYATTFNDRDDIVIDLDNESSNSEKEQAAEGEDEEQRFSGKVKRLAFVGKYNSPVVKSLKTKRFRNEGGHH